MKQVLDSSPTAAVQTTLPDKAFKKFRTSACLAKLVREPGLRRPPVAQNRSFGNVKELRRFNDIETSEEPAFDHQSLAGLEASKFIQCAIESQQIFPCQSSAISSVIDGDNYSIRSTPLLRIAAAGSFHQHLAHGAGGDPFKVQPRGRSKARRIRQLQPRLVDESGWSKRDALVAALDA